MRRRRTCDADLDWSRRLDLASPRSIFLSIDTLYDADLQSLPYIHTTVPGSHYELLLLVTVHRHRAGGADASRTRGAHGFFLSLQQRARDARGQKVHVVSTITRSRYE